MKQLLQLTILFLFTAFCQGQYPVNGRYPINSQLDTFIISKHIIRQSSMDTVKVVMQVSDTAHRYEEYVQILSCEDVGCKDTVDNQIGIAHYKFGKKDLGNYGIFDVYGIYGYEVVERYDPWVFLSEYYYTYTKLPENYFHVAYLDDKKQPMRSTVIVWQTVKAK